MGLNLVSWSRSVEYMGLVCFICSRKQTEKWWGKKWNIHLTRRVKEAGTEKTADCTLLKELLRGETADNLCYSRVRLTSWHTEDVETWEVCCSEQMFSSLRPQGWTGRRSHRGLNCLLNPTKNNAEDVLPFSLIGRFYQLMLSIIRIQLTQADPLQ